MSCCAPARARASQRRGRRASSAGELRSVRVPTAQHQQPCLLPALHAAGHAANRVCPAEHRPPSCCRVGEGGDSHAVFAVTLSSLSTFLTRQDVPIKSRSALTLAVQAHPQPERHCTFVRAEAATEWCCLEPQHSWNCIASGSWAHLVIGDVLVQTFPPANLGLRALAAALPLLSEDLCAVLDLRGGNAWVWRAARAVPWLCTIRCSLPGPTLLRRAWPQKPVRAATRRPPMLHGTSWLLGADTGEEPAVKYPG